MMKYIIEALLLGLSTGTYCTMYCAPVLIPFLTGTEKITHKRNAALVGTFLGGRFVTYCLLGFALGSAGLLVSDFFDPVLARRLSVIAYIICGAVLLLNSLGSRFPYKKDGCACGRFTCFGNDFLTAALTGLSVGLHICPPFWAAAARSASSGSGKLGVLYFLFFYIGSLPFFLPLAGIPFLVKALPVFKRIGRVAQLLIGIYFTVFAGIIPFFFS